MKKKFKFFVGWALVILWAGFIFLLSSIDFTNGHPVSDGSDLMPMIAHLIEYSVLTLLLTVALGNSGVSRRNALVTAFLLSIIYGMTDEGHQYFTPNREPYVGDWLLDASASFMVVSIFFLKWKLKRANQY